VTCWSRNCCSGTSRSSARVADEITKLKTPRLTLRGWRDSDLAPFSDLNADPRVMEYLPATLSRPDSDAFAKRISGHFSEHGFGLWAVEVRELREFIGFVGISIPRFDAHFTPCVEIGWRLAHPYWGEGYATEAAREALRYAFLERELDQIVSFTVPENQRSQRVMRKLEFSNLESEDFDHPGMPEGHRLRRHVLYRLSRERWKRNTSEGP
jgi:RimJ/RimL family protein N-acetyltransferase